MTFLPALSSSAGGRRFCAVLIFKAFVKQGWLIKMLDGLIATHMYELMSYVFDVRVVCH